jgi:hypothetical protein
VGHHSFDARRSSLPSPLSPRTACLDPNEAMAVQPAAAWLAHIRSDMGSNFCDICRDMHGVKTLLTRLQTPKEQAGSPADKQHKWLRSNDDEADHQNRVALAASLSCARSRFTVQYHIAPFAFGSPSVEIDERLAFTDVIPRISSGHSNSDANEHENHPSTPTLSLSLSLSLSPHLPLPLSHRH